MKTAIFGGTFNPVHIGHLILAEEVLRQTNYDRVLFVPVNIPPHKAIDDPGPKMRLLMLSKAVSCYAFFEVNDCEIRRSGVSYSIETIRYLVKTRIVESRPGFIIGDDQAEEFATWHEPKAIADETQIIVLHRKYRDELALDFPHVYVRNGLFPISSTDIRARVAEHAAWETMVPPEVRTMIKAEKLYGFNANK